MTISINNYLINSRCVWVHCNRLEKYGKTSKTPAKSFTSLHFKFENNPGINLPLLIMTISVLFSGFLLVLHFLPFLKWHTLLYPLLRRMMTLRVCFLQPFTQC
jgi:hypothetical protein